LHVSWFADQVASRREDAGRETGTMNGSAHYLQVGLPGNITVLISVANLVVILLMILVFALAVVLPFSSSRKDDR
jgi:hypothetical protein